MTVSEPLYCAYNVTLEFEQDALRAIAAQAIARKSGARGLRAIIETALLDTMFDLPGRKDVRKCVISRDVIEKGEKPRLEMGEAVAIPAVRRSHKPAPMPDEPSAS